MLYELQEIKIIRKKHDLTQIQLAKLAGVSQSLIAKIEANIIDPTYSKTMRIFEALQGLDKKAQPTAEKLMNKHLLFCTANDALKEVIKKMKKFSISQLPVLENHLPIGMISEAVALDALLSNKSAESKVKEIMSDAPPVIGKDASLQIVSHLLTSYPLLIVAEKGKMLGIITKADILACVYNQ